MRTRIFAPVLFAAGVLGGGTSLLAACGSDWWSNPYGEPASSPIAPCDLSKDPPSVCRMCIEDNCCTQISECTDTYRISCYQLAECWQGLHYCPTTYDLGSKAVNECISTNCAGPCVPFDGGA